MTINAQNHFPASLMAAMALGGAFGPIPMPEIEEAAPLVAALISPVGAAFPALHPNHAVLHAVPAAKDLAKTGLHTQQKQTMSLSNVVNSKLNKLMEKSIHCGIGLGVVLQTIPWAHVAATLPYANIVLPVFALGALAVTAVRAGLDYRAVRKGMREIGPAAAASPMPA